MGGQIGSPLDENTLQDSLDAQGQLGAANLRDRTWPVTVVPPLKGRAHLLGCVSRVSPSCSGVPLIGTIGDSASSNVQIRQ
jgi:hypothetical protein